MAATKVTGAPPRPALVAIDLDGTLLTSHNTISERNLHAIQALASSGMRLLLCTGRPIRLALDYAQASGLLHNAILYNGALRYDFDSQQAQQVQSMPAEVASAVIATLGQQYPQVSLRLETPQGWYIDSQGYAQQAASLPFVPSGYGDLQHFVGADTVKFVCKLSEVDPEQLCRSLAHLPVSCTWSSGEIAEIMAQGVNKQVALATLAQDLGIEAAEVAAFGDAHNDREMLSWAGISVAMGNASALIQATARYHTASNDDDGVARVLETWLA